jgi:alcohol dehydrogenase class IV
VIPSKPFRVPPTIHFGKNAAAEAGPEAKRLSATKALIVTGPIVMGTGVIQPVIDSLSKAGIGAEIYDGVDTEPTVDHVRQGVELFRDKGCDIIVGAGGGSPLDTAKAVSVMSVNQGEIRDYMGLSKVPKAGPPVIAVPTTAGTGSEVTVYTVITDPEKGVKMLIGSPMCMPSVALVDPLLTLKMPRSVTAATGLDALVHAIEAYVSVKATPMTDILCLSAIGLLYEYLPQAWANPDNPEARSRTMLAAMQAGMAISNSSVALVHGMSRPIGANFHVSHGISNAALLGVVMEFSIIGAPKRYAAIARAMGVNASGLTDMQAARLGAQAVKELLKILEVPSLTDLGVSPDKLGPLAAKMADDAIASGSPCNNPRRATREEIIGLYFAAL